MSIINERLHVLNDLPLKSGSHSSFEDGCCAMEMVAYLAGEPHSDHPACTSPVLGAFMRRLNDGLGDRERQLLKPFLTRVVGTAGDGQDEARGWLAADWLVHVELPTWLDQAGLREQADALRAMPIVDADPEALRTTLHRVRDLAWEARRAARERLKAIIWEKLKERAAVAAAVAAADAAAVAAAAAAADADAVAVADAAAAADAVADADAAADAAWERWGASWSKVYWAVRRSLQVKAEEVVAERRRAHLPSALELLERMVDPASLENGGAR